MNTSISQRGCPWEFHSRSSHMRILPSHRILFKQVLCGYFLLIVLSQVGILGYISRAYVRRVQARMHLEPRKRYTQMLLANRSCMLRLLHGPRDQPREPLRGISRHSLVSQSKSLSFPPQKSGPNLTAYCCCFSYVQTLRYDGRINY